MQQSPPDMLISQQTGRLDILEKGNTRNKITTSRGGQQLTNPLLRDEDLHQRRDSTGKFNHKMSSVNSGTKNATGETPLLETAETLKHTVDGDLDPTTTIDYDGLHTIESVKDFPNEIHHTHHVQSVHTTSSIDHLQSAMNHSQSKKYSNDKSTFGKNFISQNTKSIKTIKEIKADNAEVRKQRTTEVFQRKSSNPFGYKFYGLNHQSTSNKSSSTFQQLYRSQEWNQVLLKNEQHARTQKKQASLKNQSNIFPETEVVEVHIEQIAGGFSRNKKEQAWHKTNQSSINMLRSFRTLDFEGKDEELDMIPKSLGSVILTQTLNRNSQLDNLSQTRKAVPDEYQSFRDKKDIIHNLYSKYVQAGRMKTFTSNIIKDMTASSMTTNNQI